MASKPIGDLSMNIFPSLSFIGSPKSSENNLAKYGLTEERVDVNVSKIVPPIFIFVYLSRDVFSHTLAMASSLAFKFS